MLHGLQSHSGLFEDSQSFLAELGLPVYAFDRRGAGLSREPRGDCRDFHVWIDDVGAVAERACKDHGDERVHVLGHCFGALPATGFACAQPERVRSLVVATPALFTKVDLSLGDKLRLVASAALGRGSAFPVPFATEDLSELPDRVARMRADSLSLHEATGALFLQVRRIRAFVRGHLAALTMPVLMACAGRDPICDNVSNRKLFASIPSVHKRLIEYPRARHILEMSVERKEFFADLAHWFAGEAAA
jgi:alpha-beta hydrolase superfamily lysophospholipase